RWLGTRGVENMQPEILGKPPASLESAHAIALRVEPRREDAYPHLPRQDRGDAAADTAFGGQADVVYPVAGVIVRAAGRHDAEQLFNRFALHSTHGGDRVDAVVGERRGHQREIAAIHQDRALPEI